MPDADTTTSLGSGSAGRARQPAVGPPRNQGAASGSRRFRQFALCAHAGRHRQSFGSSLQLALRDRAAGGDEGPAHVLAARPPDRRLELGQRHGLYARAGGGLRSLAPARQRRLELRRRAPYFRRPNATSACTTVFTAPTVRSMSPSALTHSLSHVFVAAAQQAGLPFNADFNGAVQLGCGLFQVTQKNGRRWSAASAYLHPAAARENHHRHQGAGDARPDRERPRGRCRICVPAQASRRPATQEVVLAAGAINSPQLLLLSGIGPADALRARGWPRSMICRASARICRIISMSTSCGAPSAARPLTARIEGWRRSAWRWNICSTAPGRTSNVAEAGVFATSALGAATPDIQYHFIPAQVVDHAGCRWTAMASPCTPAACGRKAGAKSGWRRPIRCSRR